MMRIIPLAIAVMLTGCATIDQNQTRIAFSSQPPGATISSDGKVFGVAPQSLTWTLSNGQKTTISTPVTATWVSGATVTITMKLTAGQYGTHLFTRPIGVAGLDADIQWAMHLQNQSSDGVAGGLAAALKGFNEGRRSNQRDPVTTDCRKSPDGSVQCTTY